MLPGIPGYNAGPDTEYQGYQHIVPGTEGGWGEPYGSPEYTRFWNEMAYPTTEGVYNSPGYGSPFPGGLTADEFYTNQENEYYANQAKYYAGETPIPTHGKTQGGFQYAQGQNPHVVPTTQFGNMKTDSMYGNMWENMTSRDSTTNAYNQYIAQIRQEGLSEPYGGFGEDYQVGIDDIQRASSDNGGFNIRPQGNTRYAGGNAFDMSDPWSNPQWGAYAGGADLTPGVQPSLMSAVQGAPPVQQQGGMPQQGAGGPLNQNQGAQGGAWGNLFQGIGSMVSGGASGMVEGATPGAKQFGGAVVDLGKSGLKKGGNFLKSVGDGNPWMGAANVAGAIGGQISQYGADQRAADAYGEQAKGFEDRAGEWDVRTGKLRNRAESFYGGEELNNAFNQNYDTQMRTSDKINSTLLSQGVNSTTIAKNNMIQAGDRAAALNPKIKSTYAQIGDGFNAQADNTLRYSNDLNAQADAYQGAADMIGGKRGWEYALGAFNDIV